MSVVQPERRITLPGVSLRAEGSLQHLREFIRRIGARLFAEPDATARRHGWEITERWGGMARTYRDPRFRDRARRIAPSDPAERTSRK